MKYYWRLLICILLPALLHPANDAAASGDSLAYWLKNLPHDSVLIKKIYKVSKRNWADNPDLSIVYCKAGKRLADSLGLDHYSATFLNAMCVAYMNLAEYDKALASGKNAAEIYQRIGNKKNEAQAYTNIGVVYKNKGEYDLAIQNYLIALRGFEEVKDVYDQGNIYHNLAVVYRHRGASTNNTAELKKALEYCGLSLAKFISIHDSSGIAIASNTRGTVYVSLGENEKAYSDYQVAYHIFSAEGSLRNVGAVLNNMAAVHQLRKEYNKAIDMYRSALNIGLKTNNYISIATGYNDLSGVYYDMGRFRDAEQEVDTAISILRKIGARDLLVEAEMKRISIYKRQGRYDMLPGIYDQVISLKDSLYNERNQKVIAEMEKKYESEKKDLEINSLQSDRNAKDAEIRRQNVQMAAFACGLVLTLALAFFIYRSYRQKQRDNQLIVQQKNLLEEKQKEILDSMYYARRIQRSLLPPDGYIQKALSALKDRNPH
ncbi:MAG TPA: tetratricopeptide repeat protein [Bacteroidia bacterium]|jgi:tetratricopeptide (TPR) repeat protein